MTLTADATDVAGRHGIAIGRGSTGRSAKWIFDRETYDFLGASVDELVMTEGGKAESFSNYAILSREVVDAIPH